YALKAVPELQAKAKELQASAKASSELEPSEMTVIFEEISSLQAEISAFESRVKSLEGSLGVYLGESQKRRDQIQKYQALLLDLELWCEGMNKERRQELSGGSETLRSKEEIAQALNSAKVKWEIYHH
ncbi:Uncharacterized protein FKW44_025294, partial [Caligus rogercresseyi]